jgi:urease accessory protein
MLATMLLADGRLPTGGHAHSAGIEAAVVDGRVTGIDSLEAFVMGRLRTVTLTEAAIAVATVHRLHGAEHDADMAAVLADVDHEADVRIGPPSLKQASRRLGRQLVRVASRCWPSLVLSVASDVGHRGLHQPVALGATGVAAAVDERMVAELSVHHAVSAPAQAAVRLLGLDPYAVAALCARMAEAAAAAVDDAVAAGRAPLRELPAGAGLLLDIGAVEHGDRQVRMFAT